MVTRLLGAERGAFVTSLLDDIRLNTDWGDVTGVFAASAYANLSGVQSLTQAIPNHIPLTFVGGGAPFQTSQQAAVFLSARSHTKVYLYYDPEVQLFHPKVLAIDKRATAPTLYVGSSNVTGGGLKRNLEANIRVDLSVPGGEASAAELATFRVLVTRSSAAVRLSTSRINSMSRAGHLYDERVKPAGATPTPKGFKPSRRFASPDRMSPTEFTMILVPNDVSAKHLDDYFLVPLKARDARPDFWGWPTAFSGVPHKSRAVSISVRIPDHAGQRIKSRIYYVHSRSEFRVTCPPVHSLGTAAAGWVIAASWTSRSNMELRVFPPGAPGYASYIMRCTTQVSARKKFGYL